MKKSIQFLFFSLMIVFVSCSSSSKKDKIYASNLKITNGKEIFNGKGDCASCHAVSDELVGPSLKVISTVYKTKGNLVDFFKQKAAPIIVPGHAEGMKMNFPILNKMSEDELVSLEAYILNIK